ncbi:MAG: hypothetical protein IK130_05450 [Oscillospiraceae bacterium]|nr:hypothetical protein [Oscillospiraceae bacterium]
MNQTEKNLLSAFPEEVRNQVAALQQQWKHKVVITCLLALSATVLLTLYYMFGKPDYSVAEAICISTLFVSAVLLIILTHFENQLMQSYRQIPGLNAQPEDAAVTETAQQRYKQAARSTRVIEGFLIGGGLLLGVIVPFAVGVSIIMFGIAIILERDLRRKFPTDLSVAGKLKAPLHQRTHRIGCSSFLIFGIACAVMVFEFMLASVASAKLKALNSKAEFTYKAAEALQNDCYEKSQPFECKTVIAQYGDQNQFAAAWKTYYRDVRDNEWYAIVYDDDGNLLYALYSRTEITENELKEPDEDEQRKLLSSLTRSPNAIGCYKKRSETKEVSS